MRVHLALEDISACWPGQLHGCRLGAVLHPASVLPDLRHTVDLLRQHDGKLFHLKALFGPQHGIRGELQDNMVESAHERSSKAIPVWSLYSETREPTPEMLEGLDALLIDLQDVGSRYYTFVWTMFLCMKAAAKAGLAVVVHDRPNPIGQQVEGEPLDMAYATFVGLYAIPARHGKTIGELARQFQREVFPELQLYVLPMQGYAPEMYFEDTGLPWVLPSPNMPTVDTAVVYPGMCLLEACNISEGRGTTRPFEIWGAPWIDAEKTVAALNALKLPGVVFREHHFLPTFHKYASASVAGWNDEIFDQYRGQVCHGAQMHVIDRQSFRPLATAIAILRHCFHSYPQLRWRPASVGYEYEFEKMGIDTLLGNGHTRLQDIEAP